MLRYGDQCGFSASWAEPSLFYAAESGNYHTLRKLFFSHFDINHRIAGNQTALMRSAAHGRFHAVLWLIENGADSTVRDNDHQTAADLASNAGHDVVASLLQHHSSPDWELIKDTRLLIEEFRRDSPYSRTLSDYETLLKTQKFKSLGSLRTDYLVLPEDELIWFRATENCSIGIDDSGSIIWMFNKLRPLR